MPNYISVQLVDEQITSIVKSDLLESYKSLEQDLKNSRDVWYSPMFDMDVKEDRKHIRKLMKSLKDVMAYYGVDTDNL